MIVLSTHNNTIAMQCTYFISDYEDDLIMLFQEGLSQQEIEQELCHDITGKKYLIPSIIWYTTVETLYQLWFMHEKAKGAWV